MLRSRCPGRRFLLWLCTDCLQGESLTLQASGHCWSASRLHAVRHTLRMSRRGANSPIKWGSQDASVSPQTYCFILKSFSCSLTCFVPGACINLALQETPEFILPEGWDPENSMSDVLPWDLSHSECAVSETSPFKVTVETHYLHYLAHAIIRLDGQIFQILQGLWSRRFPRWITSLLLLHFTQLLIFARCGREGGG